MTLPIRPHLRGVIRVRKDSESRRGCLRLDRNESVLPTPPALMAEFKNSLTDELLMSYPELGVVTTKLARWLGCSAGNIYLAAGSDPAIRSIFEVFIDPGDAVVMTTPTFQMFAVYARTFQARMIEVPYGAGLQLPIERLIAGVVGSRCKLAVLANPNSPTGTVFSREEVMAFVEACGHEGAVALVDEAYFHYHNESVVDLIGRHPHLAVTRTFSKAVGLAGIRFGFVAAHEQMIEALGRVKPTYEISAVSARFAEIVLDGMSVVENNMALVKEGQAFLERRLDELGFSHYPTAANFKLIRVGSRRRAQEIMRSLKKARILIGGDFAWPVLSDCIRVGLGNREQMGRFLDAFAASVAALKDRA